MAVTGHGCRFKCDRRETFTDVELQGNFTGTYVTLYSFTTVLGELQGNFTGSKTGGQSPPQLAAVLAMSRTVSFTACGRTSYVNFLLPVRQPFITVTFY
jgi:hypothetical protein